MTIALDPHTAAQPVIACSAFNVTVIGSGHHPRVKEVSVNLHRGKFTALAGRDDSGARELLAVLAGQRRPEGGRVFCTLPATAHVPAQPDATHCADAIARAQAENPDILFVDAVGMPELILGGLRRHCRATGQTVIAVTDDMGACVNADRVIVLDHGKVVADL